MQDLRRGALQRSGRRRIDPMALSGKGICREADAPRLDVAIQLAPIELQSLDPEIEQSGQLPIGDPFVDRLLQIGPRRLDRGYNSGLIALAAGRPY